LWNASERLIDTRTFALDVPRLVDLSHRHLGQRRQPESTGVEAGAEIHHGFDLPDFFSG